MTKKDMYRIFNFSCFMFLPSLPLLSNETTFFSIHIHFPLTSKIVLLIST